MLIEHQIARLMPNGPADSVLMILVLAEMHYCKSGRKTGIAESLYVLGSLLTTANEIPVSLLVGLRYHYPEIVSLLAIRFVKVVPLPYKHTLHKVISILKF